MHGAEEDWERSIARYPGVYQSGWWPSDSLGSKTLEKERAQLRAIANRGKRASNTKPKTKPPPKRKPKTTR